MAFQLPPAYRPCPEPGCNEVWLMPIVGELCETHGFHVALDWSHPRCVELHTSFAAHLRDAHGDEEKALSIEKHVINQGATRDRFPGPFDQDG